jgi:hypothetical protein
MMKRPEQTNYPTPANNFKKSIIAIEAAIERNIFTLKEGDVVHSTELDDWLHEWGWEIKYFNGDFRDNDPGYWKLIPKNK